VFRYRPMPAVTVRGSADAAPADLLRVLLAAECAGVPAHVSVAPEVPLAEGMAAWAQAQGWHVETDAELAARIAAGAVRGRVRVGGDAAGLWRGAVEPDADVALPAGPGLPAGPRGPQP